MNAEISCGLPLRVIQSGQRTAGPQGELDIQGVIRRQPMIAADDLHGSGDLFQRRMVEGRAQSSQSVKESSCLFRRDPPPAFSDQQRVENLKRPESRHERLRRI